MKKKIIGGVLACALAMGVAMPALACTPTIKIDMSWKTEMDKSISNASKEAASKATENVVIPKEQFDFVKDLKIPKEYADKLQQQLNALKKK